MKSCLCSIVSYKIFKKLLRINSSRHLSNYPLDVLQILYQYKMINSTQ